MSRSRASAKAAGSRKCSVCAAPLPIVGPGRPRKYCSAGCLNVHRNRQYAASPRPRKVWPAAAERLWSRVEKLPSGCWEWQGCRLPFGHGQIGIGRSATTTHRVAWEATYGPIPVRAIRTQYQTFAIAGRRGLHSNREALATRFGVSPKYIADVAAGRERADV